MRVCTHACVCVYVRVCTHARVCVCTYSHVRIVVYVHGYLHIMYVYKCAYMGIHIYACVCVLVCVYTYILIYGLLYANINSKFLFAMYAFQTNGSFFTFFGQVDTNPGSQCPPSHSYGIRWLSEVPCSFDVQRCRRRINGIPGECLSYHIDHLTFNQFNQYGSSMNRVTYIIHQC